MKNLQKSEVCESREQCTGPTGVHCSHRKVNNHDSKKKRKRRRKRKTHCVSAIQTTPICLAQLKLLIEAVDAQLKSRQELFSLLRSNLISAQERMKLYADKHISERSFFVGNWVYLRLQPYKQKSISHKAFGKLSPRIYGPFQVLQKIGAVANKLDLPPGSQIHPIFHISCLKAKLGQQVTPCSTLPSVNSEGTLSPEPIAVLQERYHQLRNRGLHTGSLIQWQGGTKEDATWVNLYQLQLQFPHLVGKVF